MKLSHVIEEVEAKLEEKLNYWEEHCPSLQFNKQGRTKLGDLKPLEHYVFHDCPNRELLASYITLWCKAKRMAIKLDLFMEQVVTSADLRYTTIKSNVIEYSKVDDEGNIGKTQTMKITKLFGRWIGDIDELTKNTLFDSGLIKSYLEYYLEGVNNYLQASAGRELWLSINPLDKLTCSNTSESKLTSLKSCWETSIYAYDGDVVIDSANIYSHTYGILAVGMLLTSYTMYVPNGRTLEPFIGYSSRIQGYLRDTSTFFTELEYPSKQSISNDVINILERNGIAIDNDPTVFKLQDYNGNRKLTNYDDEIYLDYVGIDYDTETEMMGLSEARYDAYEVRGTMYCDDMSNYYQCDSCGDMHHIDDLYCHDDSLYCYDCYHNRFCECNDCYNIIDIRDDDYIYTSDGNMICTDCMENYAPCYNCYDFHNVDDMVEIDKDGETIYFCDGCTDCIDEL